VRLCFQATLSFAFASNRQEVRPLIEQFKTIVLDLTDVSYMDSSGLGTLIGLFASAKQAGKQLMLINLGARIQELFRITNLLNIFEGYGEHL
jgi:anti-sigma B factor antagonist